MTQLQTGGPQGAVSKLFASSRRAPERHLVVVHQPGWQAVEDWYRIAAHVCRIDPGIAVFVVPANAADGAAAKRAASLPTLVVSPGPLGTFKPVRGKVYHGRIIPKFEQLRRLHEGGVNVPRTTLLQPGTRLDPAEWGAFVVVKPTDIGTSSSGKGFRLMRTERVRYRPPGDYPLGHPGRHGPMMVQQFVNTGGRISAYRVLTLFGRPLYCNYTESRGDRLDLSAADETIESTPIFSQGLDHEHQSFVYDADVIAIAAAAYRAIPEVPLQGCDVLREAATGRTCVLELNPGGNTWHFSSHILAEFRAKAGPEFERLRHAQLDAFGTAAHVLAERARLEAE